jgi:DNA repair exonuclease SbcCD ATPase subunit
LENWKCLFVCCTSSTHIIGKLKKQVQDAEDVKKQLQFRIDTAQTAETKYKLDITTLKGQLQDRDDTIKKLESSNSTFSVCCYFYGTNIFQEVSRVKSELESKLADLNKQLEQEKDAAIEKRKELQNESQRKIDELIVRHEQESNTHRNEIEKLQATLQFYATEEQKRQQSLKREIEILLKRCSIAESKTEEIVTIIPDSTRPLHEQILSLESKSQAKEEEYNRVQRNLENKLKIAENRVKLLERENSKMSSNLEALRESEREKIERTIKLEEETRDKTTKLDKLTKQLQEEAAITNDLRSINDEISVQRQKLQEEVEALQKTLQSQQQQAEVQSSIVEPVAPIAVTAHESHNENNVSDNVEISKNTNYEEATAPQLLTLESTIRTQSSQIKALLDRVDSLEQAKTNLSEDLFIANADNKKMNVKILELENLRAELEQLRNEHESALELLGEKEEKLIEMEQDMQYVKDTFRKQIMDLLNANDQQR